MAEHVCPLPRLVSFPSGIIVRGIRAPIYVYFIHAQVSADTPCVEFGGGVGGCTEGACAVGILCRSSSGQTRYLIHSGEKRGSPCRSGRGDFPPIIVLPLFVFTNEKPSGTKTLSLVWVCVGFLLRSSSGEKRSVRTHQREEGFAGFVVPSRAFLPIRTLPFCLTDHKSEVPKSCSQAPSRKGRGIPSYPRISQQSEHSLFFS